MLWSTFCQILFCQHLATFLCFCCSPVRGRLSWGQDLVIAKPLFSDGVQKRINTLEGSVFPGSSRTYYFPGSQGTPGRTEEEQSNSNPSPKKKCRVWCPLFSLAPCALRRRGQHSEQRSATSMPSPLYGGWYYIWCSSHKTKISTYVSSALSALPSCWIWTALLGIRPWFLSPLQHNVSSNGGSNRHKLWGSWVKQWEQSCLINRVPKAFPTVLWFVLIFHFHTVAWVARDGSWWDPVCHQILLAIVGECPQVWTEQCNYISLWDVNFTVRHSVPHRIWVTDPKFSFHHLCFSGNACLSFSNLDIKWLSFSKCIYF